MRVTFLEAQTPLTKQFTKTAAGVEKTPYPLTWEFTSHDEDIETLADFEKVLKRHAAAGHCLLKGKIARPLVKESRAGSTATQDETQFIVLDLDGLPDTWQSTEGPRIQVTIDVLLDQLGLSKIDYIVQWSASYGIENKKLRAHVFMLLDKPYSAPLLKQWLIQLNHACPLLRDAMGLTKTGNAISWPLDVSACQNDKLIYIAPPVLKGITDPLAKGKRISLVKRGSPHLVLPAVASTSANREATVKRIEALREAAGLPKRKISYKMHGSVEVMVKPDAAVITEMKQERGFVYFNLNGGDSWAYYHPENNPDFIHSFKGEGSYLTKELLPDYWSQLVGSPRVSSTGELYLAFCDRSTSTYWRGTYNQQTDLLQLHQAKNETQIRHFAAQYGMPMGDFIPEWDLTFDPHDNVRVDPTNRTVNLFQPTPYMLTPPKKVSTPPKTIMKIVEHVLGNDKACVDHFMNWLATIVQQRDRTRTAWVLHGVPGTGKGVLMNKVLRPLLGENQTALRRMEELNEPYNHWMKSALLVFIDEVQTKALVNERGAMAKLKNFITEEIVTIRAMYSGGHESRNYANFIFASNMPDPVSIDKHDRRFNVGRYQPNKLVITDAELVQVGKELQSFYDYLSTCKADFDLAGTVLDNEDRNTMVSISESSVDTVGSAVLEGRFEFLIDQLPTDTLYTSNAMTFNKVEDYRKTLADIMARTDKNSGACSISRDELYRIFEFTVGNMPSTPNKFTSLLKHHRIHIAKVWCDGKTVNGIKTAWRDTAHWQAYHDALFPQQAAKATSKAKPKLMKVK